MSICLHVCMSSLVKYQTVYIFCPFLKSWAFLLLSYISSLFILDISSLSDTQFANIFSQSVACIFILLMISLKEQKILYCDEF